ncbi:hypothetical protein N9O57_02100 [bacterium]|nr:hypothetical protein [bacterium]
MKNEKGQSTIEYVLMTFVIATFIVTIFKSAPFQRLFGTESEFFAAMRRYIEYSYQHGSGSKKTTNYTYTDDSLEHGTYVNEAPKKGSKATRFFIPIEKYPR